MSADRVHFDVHVDKLAVPAARDHPLGGQLWVTLNNYSFPEAGWYDFPVVILSWWAQSLSTEWKEAGPQPLRFMDGPYELRILQFMGDVATVRGIERGAWGERVRFEADVPLAELRQAVKAACDTVAAFCAQHKLQSRDLDRMISASKLFVKMG